MADSKDSNLWDDLLDGFEPSDELINDEDLDLSLLDNSFELDGNNPSDFISVQSPPQSREEILAAQSLAKVQAMQGPVASMAFQTNTATGTVDSDQCGDQPAAKGNV